MPTPFSSPCVLSATVAILLLANATFSLAQSGATIYQFAGGLDGQQPLGTVVFDSLGSLYGVTSGGGAHSYGTAYKLSPPAEPGAPWIKEVLYNFTNGADGGYPFTTLVFDKTGSLYGVNDTGGDLTQCSGYGCGTIFQLTPPTLPGDSWTETTIYTFENELGRIGLTWDAEGALYTAAVSWTINAAYIFKLSPPQAMGGAWTKTVLSSVSSTNIVPNLVFDAKGALYGAVWSSIFKLSPPTGPGAGWTFRYIYNFPYPTTNPYAGPVFDKSTGHLFGTVPYGGLNDCNHNSCGVVYELAESGGVWHQENIYDFKGESDGFFPMAAVTFDSTGALFTTSSIRTGGAGSVIRLKPSTQNGTWTENTLWKVTGAEYGEPNDAVVLHDESLFGTTSGGGSGFPGTVFQVKP
jgi:uncharacterized repeat protein (TIGR03803 family)